MSRTLAQSRRHSTAFLSFILLLFVSFLTTVKADIPSCSKRSDDPAVDFVVVGAGAGGGPLAARLAEAGYDVLVIDAGHDAADNINTTIPLYFIRATEDPEIELNYTLDEYPPDFRIQKNDAWYPRSRAIGGSTIHNALINIIAETKTDFDSLASMFNDPSWSRENMQNYFKKIERNVYSVVPDLVNHGYDGWLKTNLNPDLSILNPMFLDLQTVAFAGTLTALGLPLIPDLNDLASDQALGLSLPSFTATEDHLRSSARDRLVAVNQSQSNPGSLQFATDTLATKILLCSNGSTPTAYGVELAPGAALPVAGNFGGKVELQTRNVTVRREVIVSAGVFQSPQLLMLSGIGNGSHLREFGIEPVVELPGVGTNLQDHDEISTIWRMKQNFSLLNDCVLQPDREEDPCLQFWEDNAHLNAYSFGGAFEAILSKSDHSTEPDIFTYWEPAHFEGFVRGFPEQFIQNKKSVTAINLKAHPSSKGTVQLTGSHPQDPLNIQKLHFQGENGPRDVADLREGIKRARDIMKTPLILPFVDEEIFPGAQAQTDDEIDDHIYNNIFGHHACCTNPIGSDSDPNAVLDGDFRVHGVNGLRVVDLSSWPNVPGWFVTTPTYMMSEKAADAIIAANAL